MPKGWENWPPKEIMFASFDIEMIFQNNFDPIVSSFGDFNDEFQIIYALMMIRKLLYTCHDDWSNGKKPKVSELEKSRDDLAQQKIVWVLTIFGKKYQKLSFGKEMKKTNKLPMPNYKVPHGTSQNINFVYCRNRDSSPQGSNIMTLTIGQKWSSLQRWYRLLFSDSLTLKEMLDSR